MSKSAIRLIAFILLGLFIIWLLYAIVPMYTNSNDIQENTQREERTYEPKFKDDGDLFIVSDKDTILKMDVEFADTPEEIQYGMMYRKTIDEKHGMLFFMGQEQVQSFWMKNTYVPLDIIYINSNNKIVSIQKNAQPLSNKSLPSEGPATYVLEVKGGLSDRYNIKVGDEVLVN